MPTSLTISGRSSAIAHAFISAILPSIIPTNEQVREALQILGMDHDTICCSYCGSEASEWGHLRPLVIKKKPTGFIAEIHNLVPSCGKCNQSKGNKPWRKWMTSEAKLSPRTRGIKDIDARMQRLQAYEQLGEPTWVNFEAMVGLEKWNQYWAKLEKIQEMMRESQLLADELSNIADWERKAIFGNLEYKGVLRMEKRSGIPYDYTVFVLNYNHQTVREMC
jgi:hypothetical protein